MPRAGLALPGPALAVCEPDGDAPEGSHGGAARWLRPVVVFANRREAEGAMGAAAATGTAIVLKSAPGAAGVLGCPLLAAMIEDVHLRYPDADAVAVIDCDDQPGLALAAIRTGLVNISFAHQSADVVARIADIARQAGGAVIDQAVCQPVIDLRGVADPELRCRNWLKTTQNGRISAPKRELPSFDGSCI